MASWSSLQLATIAFLARSMSSKEAPSDTPSSFSAFSTDISNGAESSARELAWTGATVLMRIRGGTARHGSGAAIGFRSGGWTGGLGNAAPGERRSGRTERVAAAMIRWCYYYYYYYYFLENVRLGVSKGKSVRNSYFERQQPHFCFVSVTGHSPPLISSLCLSFFYGTLLNCICVQGCYQYQHTTLACTVILLCFRGWIDCYSLINYDYFNLFLLSFV